MNNDNFELILKIGLQEEMIGPGIIDFLEFVDATGSMQGACEKMNMSYSKSWRMLSYAEKIFGAPLLIRESGGSRGGGSTLTEKAKLLVKKYRSFYKEVFCFTEEKYGELFENFFAGDIPERKERSNGQSVPGDSPVPSQEYIDLLFEKLQTPDNVKAHCAAVREKTKKMTELLRTKGIYLDKEAAAAGAYLHDAGRTGKNHAQRVADLLFKEGFSKVGEIVLFHEGGFDYEAFDEKKLVYLADKYVCGTGCVNIEERFERSLEKCSGEEALTAHKNRFDEAKKVEEQFKKIIGGKEYENFIKEAL